MKFPQRTLAGLAVFAAAGVVIPLGASTTANAAQTHPAQTRPALAAQASPMAAAFNTAVRTDIPRTKNSARIDCDFGGDAGGDIGGGDIGGGDIGGSSFDASGSDIGGSGVGGDGTVADAGGGGMSVAQGAFVGALSGAMTGAATALANNMLNAAANGVAQDHSASPTAFD